MFEMHQQLSAEKLLLPRIEAAHTLSISLGKLEDLIRSGQLDIVRIGRRVLVPRDALRRLLRDMEAQRHGKK
jgi:excisionase family DNA binding protein